MTSLNHYDNVLNRYPTGTRSIRGCQADQRTNVFTGGFVAALVERPFSTSDVIIIWKPTPQHHVFLLSLSLPRCITVLEGVILTDNTSRQCLCPWRLVTVILVLVAPYRIPTSGSHMLVALRGRRLEFPFKLSSFYRCEPFITPFQGVVLLPRSCILHIHSNRTASAFPTLVSRCYWLDSERFHVLLRELN
jgi:hypothetical protein